MNKKNLLVTLANENYINQAKQLFSSAYWNAGWKGDYMLLAHNIPEKKLKWFKQKGFLIEKCNLPKLKIIGKWPLTVLGKCYVFKPKFKKYQKIIFLDADIIIRGRLDNLINIKEFAAVKSGGINTASLLLKKPQIKKQFKYKLNQIKNRYNLKTLPFNTGFFIFDTNLIKNNTYGKLINLFKEYLTISNAADELIINLMFNQKYISLSKSYNLLINSNLINQKKYKKLIYAHILHFNKHKPWNKSNPFNKEWENNLKKAEKINLKKIPNGKILDKIKVQKFLKQYNKKNKRFLEKTPLFRYWILLNEWIGIFGIYIKNILQNK